MTFSPNVALACSALIAYLLGAMPFGYWFMRLAYHRDIRTLGSGNIGATNVHRTAGRKAGIVVLILDICKGLGAVWIAGMLSHDDPRALGARAFAVMVGHCYPVFLRFQGGKAVACFIGAFGYLVPLAFAAVVLVFVVTVALTKYISLGSIVGVLLFPIAAWLTAHPPQPILAASVAAALLIVYRHKRNIARLRAGTENVFSSKGGKLK